jgi:hypothetical protein
MSSATMEWLYGIPAALVLLVALVMGIALALCAQALVHRRFKQADFVGHNEVGGIIIAVVGTLYAVLLGFMTVVTWQHFTEAREIVVQEADADIDAWHVSVGLPPAVRERVRKDMIDYAKIMVSREWPLMRKGRFDPDAAMVGMDAIDATGAFKPANFSESNAQNATMQQLTIVHDARQRRISVNNAGISWFEWLVLFCGALYIICFCWLFGLRSRNVHLIMTATVVAIIVSILTLLFELEYPFRSNVGVDPTAWTSALDHIRQMETVGQTDMRM